ncbi:MAG TPA: hypothetical protein PLB02_06145 [Thermoanaerobaculia bacterium]|nr:hypothetical protein [Thermoanaerobaculia bacterium]HQR66958.1 hypothetical protein [Thermoanaerobaculia bacterium]
MKRHLAVLAAASAFSLLSAVPAAADEGKADGTLTVAKTSVKLVHVYAQAQKGFFDAKVDDVLVLLTDVPLSGAALTDQFERRKMEKEGKLHSVEAVINAKGQAINVTVRDQAFGGPPVSGGSTEDVFDSKTNDGKTIAGRLHRASPGKSFDDVPYTYDVAFSAPVAPKGKK